MGRGLAYRWVWAGYFQVVGSRTSERAMTAAKAMRQRVTGGQRGREEERVSVVYFSLFRLRGYSLLMTEHLPGRP